MRKSILLYILVLFCACGPRVDIELPMQECAPIPSPRASATCFVYKGQAYVFGGRDSEGAYLNDLWRYEPALDEWQSLGETPLKARVNATACVEGDAVYIGLGFNGRYGNEAAYLCDWWSFNPESNTWKQLANYPNHNTDRAVSFANGSQLYVGYGFSWTYARDMFCYHVPTNRWDSIDVHVDFLGYPARSFGGCGAACGGRFFYGSGYRGESLNWWAEFVPAAENETCTEGEWQKRTKVPGQGRTLGAAAATDKYVYLIGGLHYGGVGTDGYTFQDIQQYDPSADKWTCVGLLPVGLMNHLAFAIDGSLYVGVGEDEDQQLVPALYRIDEH